MNKRRILALMIVLLMASATGCGKSDINNESDEESSGSEDYWSKLYSEAKECPNAANFVGEWYGGEHSSYSGEITITDQSEKGFHFSGFFYYYLHTGEIEGDALFVKDNVAVYKSTESEDEYLRFEMDGDTMHVKQEGLLGLGMNVWAGRDYTREKKAFINDDILNKAYTESQLSEIKKLIGDELYENHFKFGTEIGAVGYKDTETKSGEKCRFVDCLVPTYGTEYTAVLMDDGKIYLKLKVYGTCDKLYTNDSAYTGEDVPETVSE
jgi:hypothetical protein